MSEAIRLSPIEKKGQNLSDFAYEALCKSIADGELKPGQRIREVEIAEAFGISRTPIREALKKLEEHHLLRHQLNGPYYVAEWDKQTLWELATLRSSLESLAINLAIENFREDDFLYLEELIDRMERKVKSQDYDRLILLDNQFHQYIWSRSGHELLQETLTQMTPQILYFMSLTKHGDEESYPEMHRELLAVLREGNVNNAMDIMQKHIMDAGAFDYKDK